MKLKAIVSEARQPFYLLKGEEKKSGESLNALFFGKEKSVAYLSDLIYSEEPSQVYLGKSFVWNVKSKARSVQPEPDAILVDFNRIYAHILKRQGFLIIPKWVLFTLDISKPMPTLMEEVKNDSLDNNLRRMNKLDFSFDITRDLDKFDFFYHRMYLPLAEKRFGNRAWIFEYHRIKRLLENGCLLLIKLNNEYLAGALLLERGKHLFSHSLGVKDGDKKYVEQGAVTATYYFTIQWAIDQGYEEIEFGYSRPFLRDGVFIYKKRWGMTVKNQDRSMVWGGYGLRIQHYTKSTRSFLTENPFIFVDGDKIKGLMLIEQKEPLTEKNVRRFMRIQYIKGLDGVIILSPHGFTPEAREMAKDQYPDLLHLAEMDVEVFFDGLSKLENRRI
ncbi:hypothetical protein ACFLT2_04765 [Acidobacteriota bacterium]